MEFLKKYQTSMCVLFLILISESCFLQAKKSTNSLGFLTIAKSKVNMNDCILFVDYDEKMGVNSKKLLSDFHKKIKTMGTKLYSPIEIAEYKGNSMDLAFKEKDIMNISLVYNELFDLYLAKANAYSKDSRLKTISLEYHENGNIQRYSKQIAGKNHLSINSAYYENGKMKDFYFSFQNNFDLSFQIDRDGKILVKELKIQNDGLGGWILMFKEDKTEYSSNYDSSATYYLGPTGDPVHVRLKNGNIISLKQSTYCSCPLGKEPEYGITKFFSAEIIDMYPEGVRNYWQDGKYIKKEIEDDFDKPYLVRDLKRNTYFEIVYNRERTDTLSYKSGKLAFKNYNGQEILYGELESAGIYLGEKEIEWRIDSYTDKRYKETEVIFDPKGRIIERIYYYPNGNVRTRSKGF